MSTLKVTPWAPSILKQNLKEPFVFRVKKELDTSTYACVSIVDVDGTNESYILKTIYKAALSPSMALRARRECLIHFEINYPFIVKLYAVIEDEHEIKLLMEHATEGDLYTIMSQVPGNRLPEEECCTLIIAPLLMALSFLHSKHVIHRDVKAENLFVTRDRIKLGDLGLAVARGDLGERTVSRVGTLGLMAPEMLSSMVERPPDDIVSSMGSPGSGGSAVGVPFSTALDVWAVGVVTYELLFGEHPFPGRVAEEVLARIREESIFPDGLSPDGEDFIKSILVCDPADRPSARELLKHPWITSNTAAARLSKSLGTGAGLSLPATFPPRLSTQRHHPSKSLEQVPLPEFGQVAPYAATIGEAILDAGFRHAGLPVPERVRPPAHTSSSMAGDSGISSPVSDIDGGGALLPMRLASTPPGGLPLTAGPSPVSRFTRVPSSGSESGSEDVHLPFDPSLSSEDTLSPRARTRRPPPSAPGKPAVTTRAAVPLPTPLAPPAPAAPAPAPASFTARRFAPGASPLGLVPLQTAVPPPPSPGARPPLSALSALRLSGTYSPRGAAGPPSPLPSPSPGEARTPLGRSSSGRALLSAGPGGGGGLASPGPTPGSNAVRVSSGASPSRLSPVRFTSEDPSAVQLASRGRK